MQTRLSSGKTQRRASPLPTLGLVTASMAGLVVAAASLGSLTLSPVAVSATDTAQCKAEFSPLLDKSDFQALSTAFETRPQPDPCSSATLDTLRTMATERVAISAQQILKNEGDPDKAMALLAGKGDARFRLVSVWQVNAVRGDIAMERENWQEASLQYESAYELSLGSLPGSMNQRKPAKPDIQQTLYRLAGEAMHLSGSYGDMIRRNGDATGIYGTRGAKPRQRPTPLTFEFDSDELNKASLADVDKIVSFLVKRDIRSLEVIGHTDWVGPDDYNLDLSQRRADTVSREISRRFRQASNSSIDIVASGMGETCPRIISDIGRYSKDHIAELYRRVSLTLPGDANSSLADCDPKGIRQ